MLNRRIDLPSMNQLTVTIRRKSAAECFSKRERAASLWRFPCRGVFHSPLSGNDTRKWRAASPLLPLFFYRAIFFSFFLLHSAVLDLRDHACRNDDCEGGETKRRSRSERVRRDPAWIAGKAGSYVIIKQSPATGPPSRRATPIH